MKIIKEKITLNDLRVMAKSKFGNLVKVVVDIEKKIMAIDGELQADEESLLLKNNSKQENLWGINLYPFETADDFIEFDSMINIRPISGNMSRGIDDPKIKDKIIKIINEFVGI